MANEDSWHTYEEALTRHLDPLYRVALVLCDWSPDDAEDLVHDALIRGMRAWGQLREPDRRRAWLFKILHTTHLNRCRARSRRPELAEEALEPARLEEALAQWQSVPCPIRQTQIDRDLQGIERMFRQMPLAWREVVWLMDVEGLSVREVADALECPAGTVASRLNRGRRRLSELVQERQERSLWER